LAPPRARADIPPTGLEGGRADPPDRRRPCPGGRVLRKIIRSQERLSRGFDKLLPEKFSIDGNSHFVNELAPQYVEPGMTIYDIGGGKNPFLSAERKAELGVRVVGLDIDAGELARAPAGAYDDTVCADIT